MHAMVADSFYMADLLLYYDADIQPKNKEGIDAMMLAAYLGRYAIAVSLIELGAEVNSTDIKNQTPLHYATLSGNLDIMDLLILNGAFLESRSANGYTPLSLAVSLNNYAAARLLIGYGADVNSRISYSLNPMTLALESKNDSLAGMLRNHEAKAVRWPSVNKITFGPQVTFNSNDLLVGFNLGISDNKYNLWSSLGYGIRPKLIRVLEAENSTTSYQYWEMRHTVFLSVDKGFFLPHRHSAIKAGAFAGLKEVMTFGSYRGSSRSPDTRLILCPRIGGVLEFKFLRFKLNYEFMNLRLKDYSNNWCNFTIELLFNRKKGNARFSQIDWSYI
jgi:hypothetical protein